MPQGAVRGTTVFKGSVVTSVFSSEGGCLVLLYHANLLWPIQCRIKKIIQPCHPSGIKCFFKSLSLSDKVSNSLPFMSYTMIFCFS